MGTDDPKDPQSLKLYLIMQIRRKKQGGAGQKIVFIGYYACITDLLLDAHSQNLERHSSTCQPWEVAV